MVRDLAQFLAQRCIGVAVILWFVAGGHWGMAGWVAFVLAWSFLGRHHPKRVLWQSRNGRFKVTA
jgi:hypothetical protein